MPAVKAAARPRFLWNLMTWSTPCSRADARRVILRAVIDHEDLDRVDARNLPRQVAQRGGQRRCLVQARNLNDELWHYSERGFAPNPRAGVRGGPESPAIPRARRAVRALTLIVSPARFLV